MLEYLLRRSADRETAIQVRLPLVAEQFEVGVVVIVHLHGGALLEIVWFSGCEVQAQ